jgi:hypothetical protein
MMAPDNSSRPYNASWPGEGPATSCDLLPPRVSATSPDHDE